MTEETRPVVSLEPGAPPGHGHCNACSGTPIAGTLSVEWQQRIGKAHYGNRTTLALCLACIERLQHTVELFLQARRA